MRALLAAASLALIVLLGLIVGGIDLSCPKPALERLCWWVTYDERTGNQSVRLYDCDDPRPGARPIPATCPLQLHVNQVPWGVTAPEDRS